MTLEQKIEEAKKEYLTLCATSPYSWSIIEPFLTHHLTEAHTAGFAEGRLRGLEQAQKLMIDTQFHICGAGCHWDYAFEKASDVIGEAITALRGEKE